MRGLVALLGAILVALTMLSGARASAQSTAFFYGADVPPELLVAYDRVVVEPGHGFEPRKVGPAELVAYVSIGEVAETSPERAHLDARWVLGKNAAWNSLVVDLTSSAFRQDLIERRFEPLWQRGYRSFFLDTLDSYQLVAKDDAARAAQRAGLVALIEALAARHPEAKLLLNRGFEVLGSVTKHVHGVVAESLLSGWDAGTRRYVETSADDQRWLRARLDQARSLGLPVIVIDYVAPGDHARARTVATRIRALGYQPFVSDPALASVGVSDLEIQPRRVLVLSNDDVPSDAPPEALATLAPVLEQLGLVAVHHDLRAGLPRTVPGSLAGIVTWLSGPRLPEGYGAFLRAQIALGVRIAMFGTPGLALDGEDARALGLEADPLPKGAVNAPPTIAQRDAVARFEAEPLPSALALLQLRVRGPGVTEHLAIRAGTGRPLQAVVTTAWGGLASSHYFAPRGLSGERAWVLDPYAFVGRALAVPPAPRPDLTTEHGARLALFTVRAQGLAETSRHEGRPTNAALLSSLLTRYPVPHVLDAQPSEHNAPSRADVALARGLHERAPIEHAAPPPGRTRLTRSEPSVTGVEALALGTRAVPLPMAGDFAFVPSGIGEAYPYKRAAETIALTDAPRRLLPVALDYHASSLGSDGGYRAIEQLYRQLVDAGLAPTRYAAHVARAEAYRTQVLARDLSGAHRVLGGAALRTLRLDASLGQVDLARSRGVASVSALPQGTYVTFLPDGERRLVLAEHAARLPHLGRVNADVRAFTRESVRDGVWSLRFTLAGYLDLAFEARGLPPGARCVLSEGTRRWERPADAEGAVRFVLPRVRAGQFGLSCAGGAQ
ncbi:MAG: endo alpha-1,4 polygalactosaminidase [Polyangiales bacterium]